MSGTSTDVEFLLAVLDVESASELAALVEAGRAAHRPPVERQPGDREYVGPELLDLVAVLAEHCTHEDAAAISAEVGLRVALLGGVATGVMPLEPGHVQRLLFGAGGLPA